MARRGRPKERVRQIRDQRQGLEREIEVLSKAVLDKLTKLQLHIAGRRTSSKLMPSHAYFTDVQGDA